MGSLPMIPRGCGQISGSRTLRPINDPHVPEETFLFREHQCEERECDCRHIQPLALLRQPQDELVGAELGREGRDGGRVLRGQGTRVVVAHTGSPAISG